MKYVISDGEADTEVEASSMEAAIEMAQEWLGEVDWDAALGTVLVEAMVTGPDGEERTARLRVDPEEPQCADGGDQHDWQRPHDVVGGLKENPGVWGHGGGIIATEVCMRCGLRRVTDTWHDDGHGGHMEHLRYEEGE